MVWPALTRHLATLNCRPYVRLTEYDIVEPEMRDIILRKLSTKVLPQ